MYFVFSWLSQVKLESDQILASLSIFFFLSTTYSRLQSSSFISVGYVISAKSLSFWYFIRHKIKLSVCQLKTTSLVIVGKKWKVQDGFQVFYGYIYPYYSLPKISTRKKFPYSWYASKILHSISTFITNILRDWKIIVKSWSIKCQIILSTNAANLIKVCIKESYLKIYTTFTSLLWHCWKHWMQWNSQIGTM